MLEDHRSGTYTPREFPDKMSDKDPHGKITNGSPTTETQHTESRLLTKKQLSDMAFGIRELSKKLSHVKLKLNVRNIFVLTKAHDESLIGHTAELTEWLLKSENGYTVWVEDKLEEDAKFGAKGILERGDGKFEGRLKYWDNELCRRRPNTFDIVLGVCSTILVQNDHLTHISARRRRHSPLRQLALPAHRPARPRLQHGLPRLPHQIRFRALLANHLARGLGRRHRLPPLALRRHSHALAGTQGVRRRQTPRSG